MGTGKIPLPDGFRWRRGWFGKAVLQKRQVIDGFYDHEERCTVPAHVYWEDVKIEDLL